MIVLMAGGLIAAVLAACGAGSDSGAATEVGTQSATRADLASFGLTSDANFYTIDTGADLVFKVRRVDNGSSTQSAGDVASMIYKGGQY